MAHHFFVDFHFLLREILCSSASVTLTDWRPGKMMERMDQRMQTAGKRMT